MHADETVSCQSSKQWTEGGVVLLMCCKHYLFLDVLISTYQNFATGAKTTNIALSRLTSDLAQKFPPKKN